MANDLSGLQYKIFGPKGIAKLGGALDWTTKMGAGKEEVTTPDLGKSFAKSNAGKKVDQIRNALVKKLGIGYTAPEAIAKFGVDIATFLPREAWETGRRAGEIAMSRKMGQGEKDIKQLVNVAPMVALALSGGVGGKLAGPIKSGLGKAVVTGATSGGMFGGTNALSEGVLNDKKLRETVVNVLKQGAMGAGSGAVLGGALYGAGKGIGKVKESLKGIDLRKGAVDFNAPVGSKSKTITGAQSPTEEYQSQNNPALGAHYQIQNGGFQQAIDNRKIEGLKQLAETLNKNIPSGTKGKAEVINSVHKALQIVRENPEMVKSGGGNMSDADWENAVSDLGVLDDIYYKYGSIVEKALKAKPIEDVGIMGMIRQNAGKNPSFQTNQSNQGPGTTQGQAMSGSKDSLVKLQLQVNDLIKQGKDEAAQKLQDVIDAIMAKGKK